VARRADSSIIEGVRPPRGARLILLGALTVCTAAGCGSFREPNRQEVLDRILPSSVQIVVEQREGRRLRTGSGVAIAARRSGQTVECLVLTAGHTVSGLVDRVSIYTLFGRQDGTGTKVPATVVAHADTAELDVAVLSAPTERCAPAVATGPPTLGEPVWVVAFPWGGYMTLATGVVSQIRLKNPTAGEPPARFMIDALVGYGASGSGVYQASTGRLLGIVEGYGTARVAGQGATPGWYIDVPMPGQTFVTPLADVQRYLRKSGHGDVLAIAE
jgi:S1-C subfamily serine protease